MIFNQFEETLNNNNNDDFNFTYELAKNTSAQDDYCFDETSTMNSSDISSPTLRLFKRSYTTTEEDIYDRIEKFLDEEGLFITIPSPSLSCKSVKNCPTLANLAPIKHKLRLGAPAVEDDEIPDAPIPSFLARRMASCPNANTSNGDSEESDEVSFNTPSLNKRSSLVLNRLRLAELN